GPSSGRALQVPTQDRRPSLYRDVLEAEASRRPLAEHGPAAGSLHVVKPVRALTEHRHQVTLVLVIRDQHRKRDDAAAAPSPDLERRGTLGPDPGANTMAEARFAVAQRGSGAPPGYNERRQSSYHPISIPGPTAHQTI